MLLGKKYTRIKRSFNAATFEVSFRKKDDSQIKLPRKLNMLAVVSMYSKVNQKAVNRECKKLIKSLCK